MSGYVASVNLGAKEPNPAKGVGVTGIRKRPVDVATLRPPGPKRGGLGSGLVGDFIGDTRHHGGDRQAVYAFAREELDEWERRLDVALPNGWFGENLTTLGLDVDAALIGDRWAVGDGVVLEVTGPRIPCATFAARMGIRGWVKAFAAHGRSGAYLAVIAPGEVGPGDPVRVVERADHDADVPTTFRAFMGDLDAAEHVLAVGCLPEWELEPLRDMLERRRPKGCLTSPSEAVVK